MMHNGYVMKDMVEEAREIMGLNKIPQLTDEQRAANLEKAKAQRRLIADIKAKVKDGTLKVSEVLDMDEAKRMKVSALIQAVPGWGKTKADAWMEKNGIAENRRVQGLGEKQRAALVETFG